MGSKHSCDANIGDAFVTKLVCELFFINLAWCILNCGCSAGKPELLELKSAMLSLFQLQQRLNTLQCFQVSYWHTLCKCCSNFIFCWTSAARTASLYRTTSVSHTYKLFFPELKFLAVPYITAIQWYWSICFVR